MQAVLLIINTGGKEAVMRIRIAILACMLGAALIGSAQEDKTTPQSPVQKTDKLEWQLEGRWGGIYATPPFTAFTNIPASYRTVPYNPGDGVGQATIPYTSINPVSILAMPFVASTGLMVEERMALRAGLGINALLRSPISFSPGNTGVIREVDIGSGIFQRGYGTSLVYNVIRAKSRSIFFPVPEVEVRVGFVGLLVGATRMDLQYVIERGWDRYDAFQKLDELPLANVTATHIYGGIRCCYTGYLDRDRDERAMFGGGLLTIGPVSYGNPSFLPQAAGTTAQGGHGLTISLTGIFGGPVRISGKHRRPDDSPAP
jgi:hypothetical protein